MKVGELVSMLSNIPSDMDIRFVDSQDGKVMVPASYGRMKDVTAEGSAGTTYLRIELSS